MRCGEGWWSREIDDFQVGFEGVEEPGYVVVAELLEDAGVNEHV